MEYQTILVDTKDGTTTLTMHNPKTLNALDPQTVNELYDAMARIEADADTRVVVLTGEGKAFIAGADIEVMSSMTPEAARAFAHTTTGLCRKMRASKKVWIAAINGFALGGGFEVALGCDILLAADSAKMGLPEVGLGVLPGGGGTQRLPRLVGTKKALELILTGGRFTAAEALEMGIVNRVLPAAELMDTAYALAGRILQNAPLAVQYAKECIHMSDELTLDAGLEYENSMWGLCFSTSDQKEGMGAFVQKRPASFTGS